MGIGSFIKGARVGMFSYPPMTDTVDYCGKINIVVLKCEVFLIFHCQLFRKDLCV